MNTFNIYFDGGTDGINTADGKGCSGNGYGSWEVSFNGFSKKVGRTPFNGQKFNQIITNNVAEYLALIGALIWLQTVKEKSQYLIKIHGDSQLVLYQVNGSMGCKKPNLQSLRDKCLNLMKDFHNFECEWQRRAHSVKRFGH